MTPNEYASQVEVIACQSWSAKAILPYQLSDCRSSMLSAARMFEYLYIWDPIGWGSQGSGVGCWGLERPTSLSGSSASQNAGLSLDSGGLLVVGGASVAIVVLRLHSVIAGSSNG